MKVATNCRMLFIKVITLFQCFPTYFTQETVKQFFTTRGTPAYKMLASHKTKQLHYCQYEYKYLHYIWHFSQYLKKFCIYSGRSPNDVLQNSG
jgi:hypothetical protein